MLSRWPDGLFEPQACCFRASYCCRETWCFGSSPLALSRRSWRHGHCSPCDLINTFVATGLDYCVSPAASRVFALVPLAAPKIHFECRATCEAAFAAVFRPFAERGALAGSERSSATAGVHGSPGMLLARSLPAQRLAMSADTTPRSANWPASWPPTSSRSRWGAAQQAIERQRAKKRLFVRDRLKLLLDDKTPWLELGLWAGWEMYAEWGGAPAAGVVCGIGTIGGRRHMIIANDATVKAGAFFPATAKKVLRAQRIAMQNRLPLVYLVDSAGVFLPLQEDVFPDEDDFGRIFRNNAVISAAGLGQIAAIMGNCVAGGGYLPVLCDKLLMTEGSGLYLAGPALVKSAIGQEVSSEELGGAEMHAADQRHDRLSRPDRRSVPGAAAAAGGRGAARSGRSRRRRLRARPRRRPRAPARDLYDLVSPNPRDEYEVRDVLDCIVDAGSFDEYKAEYGQTLVCGTARLGGFPVGIVANQHHRVRPADGPIQFGGVLYVDSAEKAARFVMNCNQDWLPILFLQDVNGFMVGRDSERVGHHQGRGQAGQRHQQQPRAEADGDHRRLVRGGQLRPVRQGVRSAVHLRLADGPLRRDGGRAGHVARCWT